MTNENVSSVEVKEAIFYHHLTELKKEMEGYKKLDKMRSRDLRVRPEYSSLGLAACRMGFRLDCLMFDCRGNMPRRYRNDLRCRACTPDPAVCGPDETQEHLEVCVAYSHLHDGLDILNVKDRITYFTRVKKGRVNFQEERVI